LDAAAARAAVARLAPLWIGTSKRPAAGIVRLIDHAMARVLRIVTVERGLDPREFAIVAFGGAGPLHGLRRCRLTWESRASSFPQHPGLFCAHGLLEAELHTDDILAVLRSTGEMDHAAVQRWFEESEERAGVSLIAQGVQPQRSAFAANTTLAIADRVSS